MQICKWGHWIRVSVYAATILFAAQIAWAVEPATYISQYAHSAWRNQDGFFTGSPTSIAQTPDGYLWIGTANGLFRFDGVRFVSWSDFAHQEDLATAEISALLGARDGSLWIGAGYHFYRWKDNSLLQFSARNQLDFVTSIIESRHGEIWLIRARQADRGGPLCEVQGQGLHCYGQSEGVPLVNGTALAEDASGSLWAAAESALLRWQPASSNTWHLKSLGNSNGLNGIDALVVDRKNSLWVGLDFAGPGLGLERFRAGVWTTFLSPQLNGSRIAVSRLLLDKDDALWVGTQNQGIYRIIDDRVDHFDSTDGLTDDKITALFQDREGTIWVATSKGIDSFHDLPVVSLSKREGLNLDNARSVLSSGDGTIWIGNLGALDAWRNGVVTSILPKDGLPGREVTSLLEDPSGGLLVGIDDGLFHVARRKFVPVIQPRGPHVVFAMTSGVDGSVWASTSGPIDGTVLRLQDGHLSVQHKFGPEDDVLSLATDPHGGIWLAGDRLRYMDSSGLKTVSELGARYGYIRNTAVDDDDFLWFGATKGLIGLRAGKLHVMTTANGLPCERINTLILDSHRSLWLYAQCGLIRIGHNELENWWLHPNVQVKTTVFDALDGFQGGPSPFRPAAAKSSDGRLWFVNDSVVQTINPDRLYINQLPPPVHIEQVLADKRDYSPRNTIRLPKLTQNIEINYTALSFVVPQRVRFRYRLEGYDSDWQEAGIRRSAFYTNLRPNTYRFLVIACNNSGVWNNQGAAVSIVILPAWYQTMSFRLVAFLCLALLGYALYLLRMRQYAAAMRARFNERLDERVRIARELHDTLLQSFHGLMFQFQGARNLLPGRPESAMQAMDEAILATEQALGEGRAAIRDLRPDAATEHDLAELLTAAGQELAGIHTTNGHLTSYRVIVEGKPRKLSSTIQDETYRIGSEVIRNAFNHADAGSIEVEIRYDEHEMRLRIRDDGKGIDPGDLEGSGRPGHWGLQGVRERAQRIRSRLNFWSEAGAGTEIELRIPAAIAYAKERRGHRFRHLYRGGRNGERT